MPVDDMTGPMIGDNVVEPHSEGVLDYKPELGYKPAELALEGCIICCGKCMKFLYKK